jgi:hypothetical protein
MTQIRRRLGDYVSSKYLNSAAVAGQEGPAVITHVSEETVKDERKEGGERLALLVSFDRWPDQALDLNVTNIRALQDMFGEDVSPDELRGRRVYVGTHMTNFGKGILLSPCPDSVAMASAGARQRIANARAAQGLEGDPPTLALVHSHVQSMPCSPDGCDVARAISLGHAVNASWPEETIAPPELNGPPPFVPQHQPPHGAVVGTGPQARRVPSSQPPAAPASHAAQRAQAHEQSAPPGQYHPDDPGPGSVEAPADDDIPF